MFSLLSLNLVSLQLLPRLLVHITHHISGFDIWPLPFVVLFEYLELDPSFFEWFWDLLSRPIILRSGPFDCLVLELQVIWFLYILLRRFGSHGLHHHLFMDSSLSELSKFRGSIPWWVTVLGIPQWHVLLFLYRCYQIQLLLSLLNLFLDMGWLLEVLPQSNHLTMLMDDVLP